MLVKKHEDGTFIAKLVTLNEENDFMFTVDDENLNTEFFKPTECHLYGEITSPKLDPDYEDCLEIYIDVDVNNNSHDILDMRIKKNGYKDYLERYIAVDVNNISHEILDIYIEKSGVGFDGKDVIDVYGIIKPSGPFKNTLINHLNNVGDVSFGMRALVRKTMIENSVIQNIEKVITFDLKINKGVSNG